MLPSRRSPSVALMQIMTMKDVDFTSERLIEIADCQDALHAGQHAQHQHNVAAIADHTGHSQDDISTTLSALDDQADPDDLTLESAHLTQPPSACRVPVLQADGSYRPCGGKHWTAFHPGPCPRRALTGCKGDGTCRIPHDSNCPNHLPGFVANPRSSTAHWPTAQPPRARSRQPPSRQPAMSGSARHTPHASLLTDEPTVDDYGAPEYVPSLDEAYSAAGALYANMIQTEVDLAHQLAHATDSADCAHIARVLDQSRELRHQIFSEPAPTQPSTSSDIRPIDTAALLASYDAMQQPPSFTNRAYATSTVRADTTDAAEGRQFPATWKPWGAGGDFDGSDTDDDAVLSAMHDASALTRHPTPTPPALATLLLCRAGHPVTGFRDELSAIEFCVSGLCQACQDDVFEPKLAASQQASADLAGPFDTASQQDSVKLADCATPVQADRQVAEQLA